MPTSTVIEIIDNFKTTEAAVLMNLPEHKCVFPPQCLSDLQKMPFSGHIISKSAIRQHLNANFLEGFSFI